MRKAGLHDALRDLTPIPTTPAAKAAGRSPGLVQRRFTTDAPNRPPDADTTIVRTRSGLNFVALVAVYILSQNPRLERLISASTESSPLHAPEMASSSTMYAPSGLVRRAPDPGSHTYRCATPNALRT